MTLGNLFLLSLRVPFRDHFGFFCDENGVHFNPKRFQRSFNVRDRKGSFAKDWLIGRGRRLDQFVDVDSASHPDVKVVVHVLEVILELVADP